MESLKHELPNHGTRLTFPLKLHNAFHSEYLQEYLIINLEL